jgi:hypothetical protein
VLRLHRTGPYFLELTHLRPPGRSSPEWQTIPACRATHLANSIPEGGRVGGLSGKCRLKASPKREGVIRERIAPA